MKGSIEYTVFKLPMNSSKRGVPYEMVYKPIDIMDYVPVYRNEIFVDVDTEEYKILEELFELLNCGIIDNYYSTDIGSGDVFMFVNHGIRTFWYCDVQGWVEPEVKDYEKRIKGKEKKNTKK